jgi:hypothetical protein
MFGQKKCDPQSDLFDLCVPAGTECSTVSTQDTCQGSTIVYCDDGFTTQSDCTSLGFSGCGPLKVGETTLGALCN